MRAAFLSALALTACVTAPRPAPEPPPFVLRLTPASLGREVSLSQRITLVREGARQSFDALLEVDASAVRVALLGAGQTLGSLTWDGERFTRKASAFVPQAVTAERIITDIELAFWPEDAVRAGLPEGFALTEREGRRELSLGGEPFATVTWDAGHRRVVLTQHRFGYVLEIESVDA